MFDPETERVCKYGDRNVLAMFFFMSFLAVVT